jgi:AcrR family transcriptional regulator
MARTREFNDDKVKDALRDVFWQGGFDGTSYTDIMKATGLQKGSLYAAFGDKRALYQVALTRYNDADVSAGVTMLRNDSLGALERIGLLLDSTVNGTKSKQGRWGCLLCNAATEVAPTDKEVETTVKASMDRLFKAIDHVLSQIGKEDMTAFVLSSYFGARTFVKAGYDTTTLLSVKAGVMRALEDI